MKRLVPLGFLLLLTAVGCTAFIDFSDPEEPHPFLPYDAASDVKFPHDMHSDDCASCHPGIDPDAVLVEDVKDKSALMRPTKESCFECHERGQSCTMCHEQMSPDVAPPSHTMGFRRRHEHDATQSHARCDWCHGEPGRDNGCQTCHNTMKPADHGGRWKNSGHGRAAVHDRDRCFVCHRSDQCARCHSQPPETHTELFRIGIHGPIARRKLRSCFACHSFERTCAQCHQ